jgi:ATP-binding cassette subfamily C protein EexD
MILKLPKGYDTVIDSTGGLLSGGQRQRIGLARAVYGEPKFILLDEPNSNLDDQGELALAKALQQLKSKQVTVVVITHRTGVLNLLDKLLILKDGNVVNYGNRADVLQQLQQNIVNTSKKATPLKSQPTVKPVI